MTPAIISNYRFNPLTNLLLHSLSVQSRLWKHCPLQLHSEITAGRRDNYVSAIISLRELHAEGTLQIIWAILSADRTSLLVCNYHLLNHADNSTKNVPWVPLPLSTVGMATDRASPSFARPSYVCKV